MKTLKRIARIFLVFLIILVALVFVATERVDRRPYLESNYFKATLQRADSLKKNLLVTNDSIHAGFARVNITPGINHTSDNPEIGKFVAVPLSGYGARKGKPATGVHDSLYVKAAAIRSGERLLVFVSADLLIMPPNIIDTLTVQLRNDGVNRDQLFFSATHSHSSLGAWGPGFIAEQFSGKENRNVEKWLVSRIRRAVLTAISDLKPATIGSGSFKAGNFTRNRVIGKIGTKNDDFNYIVINQAGYKKAILGSFSAHSTTMGADNMLFSADYPGYWERKTESTSADLALFFAGSIGSQSPVSKGEGFEKPENIGEALADSLNENLQQVKLSPVTQLSAISLKVDLPPYNMRLTTRLNLATFLTRKLMPEPENVYIQAARIGNMIWITTPSDFSGEYAVQIKNNLVAKGFESTITSFNGSYVGYIVPGRYFYMDEYESKLMGWFGPNMGDYTMDLINQLTGAVIN